MLTRFAEIGVLVLMGFVLVPALFWYSSNGESMYISKFFYLFLFLFLIIIGILTPIKFKDMNIIIKYCSVGLSGWFMSALIYELCYFFTPEDKMPNLDSADMFTKHFLFFTLGLVAIYGYRSITTQLSR